MADAYLNSLLGDREKILLVTRQHWFLLFRNILFELVLILITIIGITLILVLNPVAAPLAGFGYLLVLLPLSTLIRDFMVWNSHKYIITNRRVIQIFGVFNKNVTDSSLEKVNDVKLEQSYFGRMFNFGDVEILTASELGINRFTSIGNPIEFKTTMQNAKFKLGDIDQDYGYASMPAANPTMDVPRLIQELDALRKQGMITEEEFTEKKAKLLARI
jgi:uncharacterized membrane protein YdbT with pleckstrin-like domain